MRKTIFLLIMAVLAFGCGGGEEAAEAPPEDAVAADATDEMPDPFEAPMVLIPGGEYTVGSDWRPEKQQDKGQWWEPPHTTTVEPFMIDVYEVTFEQFLRFDIAADREYKIEGDWRSYYAPGKELKPVPNVTFKDAKAFCEWKGKRLPTEIEWEVAARGKNPVRYPWGDEWDATKTNTNERGFSDTMEVGQNPEDKSEFGVYDMMGNVQEWTDSRLKPYPDSPARTRGDRAVYDQNLRVVRGGSYALKGSQMGLFVRMGFLEGMQSGTGIRCVQDAPEEGSEEDSESASN
ncbi:MAG TPA: formylglycine-generating enzyme family protein [Acidobacteriota bacterium]|nr:formylglycine-generating enzyme family protein [Acidobacteriota bacterium]